MIENLRRDPIVSFLLRNSSLTETQLDTIMASTIEGNLAQKAQSREKGKVSKGAFVRTLRQGQGNVEASLYTLMLLVYLGLVKQERFDQFLRTQRLFAQVKELQLDSENISRLIDGMSEFAQEFSGRKQ